MESLPLVPDVFVTFIGARCATCLHWKTEYEQIGECRQIADEMVIYTRAEFGCVLHEVKDK